MKGIYFPNWNESLRRLEKPSSLKNRPLDFPEDEPVGNLSTKSEALWHHHNLKLKADLSQARLSFPKAGLQYKDPLGIRMALLLLLMIGGFYSGNDWARRIGDSFTISLSSRMPTTSLNVWITPPVYTNKAPISLVSFGKLNTEHNLGPIRVPFGSKIDLNLTGTSTIPDVSLGSKTYLLPKGQKIVFLTPKRFMKIKPLKLTFHFWLP